MGEHRSPYAFRSGHPQSALNGRSQFGSLAPERPDAAFSLEIDDGLMFAEFTWRRWRARAIEVGRRAQHEAPASCDTASGERRVHQLSHPESHIDALLDEVDLTFVQNDLQVQLRILRHELGQ